MGMRLTNAYRGVHKLVLVLASTATFRFGENYFAGYSSTSVLAVLCRTPVCYPRAGGTTASVRLCRALSMSHRPLDS